MSLCLPKEWGLIGKELAKLPLLQVLELKECDSGDVLCGSVSECKFLQRVIMGKQQLIQRPAT